MEYALIIWKKDPAGNNIKNNLLKLYNFSENGKYDDNDVYSYKNISLYTSEIRHINCEHIDERLKEDVIIFLTTHRSESKIPSLSVHVAGNWGKAELGGEDKQLSIAYPSLMKEILFEIKKNNTLENFEVIFEVSHHGPLLTRKPSMFVEIGSSEKEWSIPEAGKIIASSVMNCLSKKITKTKAVFGIGGLHTAPILTKAVEKSEFALAHICPKYNLENLDEKMVKQAFERSCEKIEFALLDWKGMGKEKTRIIELLEKLNIEYKRTDKI